MTTVTKLRARGMGSRLRLWSMSDAVVAAWFIALAFS
jgi:hypothetical protein